MQYREKLIRTAQKELECDGCLSGDRFIELVEAGVDPQAEVYDPVFGRENSNEEE